MGRRAPAGLVSGLLAVVLSAGRVPAQDEYVPGPGDAWERRPPARLGFDPARLRAAIDYAVAHETSMPRDPGAYLRERFAGLPDQELVGPTRERGGVNGIVVRHGRIAAEWGDTRRIDMTFSVTKSYLSTLAGLALDRGLIPSMDARVAESLVGDPAFASPHNGSITWQHLFTQTSEWEGTLFGKPDTADRRRGRERTLREPGSFWEYNDVRVNLAAYALLRLFGEPLPELLRREVMEPIGASDTWRWHGYSTSWVELAGGRRVQSVSGGGHWGGGLWISTRDHARFGLLFLRRGRWGEHRLLSEAWVRRATTPVPFQTDYGCMWWLNTGRRTFPSAPESSVFAIGAANTNLIWIDPEHDVVVVTRWIEGSHVNAFLGLLLRALRPGGPPG